MSRPNRRVRIPAILEDLIDALHQQQFHDAEASANALRGFAQLAACEIFSHGVFAADNPEVYQAIELVANRHLGFVKARREFGRATGQVHDVDLRERIQSSALEVQATSDRAYFYAGLAFGVTLAGFGSAQ